MQYEIPTFKSEPCGCHGTGGGHRFGASLMCSLYITVSGKKKTCATSWDRRFDKACVYDLERMREMVRG